MTATFLLSHKPSNSKTGNRGHTHTRAESPPTQAGQATVCLPNFGHLDSNSPCFAENYRLLFYFLTPASLHFLHMVVGVGLFSYDLYDRWRRDFLLEMNKSVRPSVREPSEAHQSLLRDADVAGGSAQVC